MIEYELIYDHRAQTVRPRYKFDNLQSKYEIHVVLVNVDSFIDLKENLALARAAGRASIEASVDWEFNGEQQFKFGNQNLNGIVIQHKLTYERITVIRHNIKLKAGSPFKLRLSKLESGWKLLENQFTGQLLPKQFEELDENGSPRITEGHTVICLKPKWIMQAGKLSHKGWHLPQLAKSADIANDWRFWYAQRDYQITPKTSAYINPAERLCKDAIIAYLCAGKNLYNYVSDNLEKWKQFTKVFQDFQQAQINELRGIEWQPTPELIT